MSSTLRTRWFLRAENVTEPCDAGIELVLEDGEPESEEELLQDLHVAGVVHGEQAIEQSVEESHDVRGPRPKRTTRNPATLSDYVRHLALVIL